MEGQADKDHTKNVVKGQDVAHDAGSHHDVNKGLNTSLCSEKGFLVKLERHLGELARTVSFGLPQSSRWPKIVTKISIN
jgi:hypothetical protein